MKVWFLFHELKIDVPIYLRKFESSADKWSDSLPPIFHPKERSRQLPALRHRSVGAWEMGISFRDRVCAIIR